MRWPTLIEQSVGVLLLVFLATACMAALFVGLGSVWVREILIASRDIYANTVKAAVREIAKQKQIIDARNHEIDDLVATKQRLEQAVADEHRARQTAETRLKDAHEQIERLEATRTRPR